MDTTAEEQLAAKQAREAIGRLLRPRGELMAEKRVMAQELAQSIGQEELGSPIFLVDPDKPFSASDAPNDKQREFIEAVQTNVRLQKELSRLRAEHRAPVSAAALAPSSARADTERRLLEEQLECSRLEKERQRLEALNKCYKQLGRQLAAAPDFLDPNVMFRGCAPFPELPKELVEGFTRDQEAPSQEAQGMILRLRKATLRQKLVLDHDRHKLKELKAKQPIAPKDLPPETQVAALNAVKNSLVNWIEVMLSKAGEDEAEEAEASPSKENENKNFDRDAQLADIEKEYKRHIELRKQIMASISQLRELKGLPRAEGHVQESRISVSLSAVPEPQTYLLTPYLEKLQALSREQKGFVQEKAHINATMTRQQQETKKMLRRLTQESRLLLKYPLPKSEQHSSLSFAKATKSASIAEQIQPWLIAADSAKISTLEAVAEAVDQGQLSLEDAMQALAQVSMLQNKGPLQVPEDGKAGSAEGEMEFLGKTKRSSGSIEKRSEKRNSKAEQKSIWSTLDGNLGLINE
ncbi:hypothetical protein GGR51DRAFT_220807 [Nemania sp. FL0031]|nr:hypothetical protein GGR51DRAFT_220807 [Nemania sp. FL0031]